MYSAVVPLSLIAVLVDAVLWWWWFDDICWVSFLCPFNFVSREKSEKEFHRSHFFRLKNFLFFSFVSTSFFRLVFCFFLPLV